MRGLVPKKPKQEIARRLVPKKTKTIWRTQVRKFHFSSICNVLPCELRLFWYSTRALNLHLANKLPTCGRQSADCWQKICVKGGKRQSADSRPTVGRLSADCWPTVGRQFFGGAVLHFFPNSKQGSLKCEYLHPLQVAFKCFSMALATQPATLKF